MPKGQNPQASSLAKLSLLDKKLKNAQDIGTFRRLKSLFQAYTGEFKGSRTPEERKKIAALKVKIDKRSSSLGKNAKSKGGL
jgi:hypothetical protein